MSVVIKDLLQHRGYFTAEILSAFLEPFAHFITGEPAHRDTLTGFGNLLSHKFTDSLLRRFHKRLIEQHGLFVKLVQTALSDLLVHMVGLFSIIRLFFSL